MIFNNKSFDDIEDAFNRVVVESFVNNLYNDNIISEELSQNEEFIDDMVKEYKRHKDPHMIYEILMEAFHSLDVSDYEQLGKE